MKKKILIASYPLEAGGTTTSLLSLLNEIDYERYDVDLLLLKKKGEFLDRVPKEVNILEQALPVLPKIIDKLYKLLVFLIKGVFFKYVYYSVKNDNHHLIKFQILSTQGWGAVSRKLNMHYDTAIGFMEGWPDFYIAKKVNADKKFAWVHVEYAKSGLDPRIDRGVFEKADSIVLVSPFCKSSFDICFPEFASKSVIMENIISPNVIRKLADEPVDFDTDPAALTLITVARLRNEHKGLDRAVNALANLRRIGYNVKWYIIGEGEDRQALEDAAANSGIEDYFILLGGRKNPYPYIKKADAFVLPSRYEGKPMAVTEAQILGIPVIATAYGSAHEQIEDNVNGLVVENNDGAIYDAIKKVLDKKVDLAVFAENLKKGNFDNKDAVLKFYRLIDE
ncbi:MAG: glycosyltransferase [Bacillota bacterium]|nr:glycosyltransferase [Bacillota bacterium]